MSILIRSYRAEDVPAMRAIWNEVVEEGVAFPQTEPLGEVEARTFFAAQTAERLPMRRLPSPLPGATRRKRPSSAGNPVPYNPNASNDMSGRP